MNQQYHELNLKGVFVFKPKILKDLRGFFFENFNLDSFIKFSGIDLKILQENISSSKKMLSEACISKNSLMLNQNL